MAFTREQLERDFICPKCRARGALVQEIQFSRSVAIVIPLLPNRYLAASCALCGYTEFYNMSISVKGELPDTAIAPLATEKAE